MRPGHSNKAGALTWAPRDRGGCGARRGREQGGDRGPSAVGAVGPGGGAGAGGLRTGDPGRRGLWDPGEGARRRVGSPCGERTRGCRGYGRPIWVP